MRRPDVFIAVLSILTLPVASVAQPQILFDGDEVVVEGIVPGGKVALLSAGIERRGFLGHQFRSDDLLIDDDGDGTVRLDLGRPAPRGSLWVAVGLLDGGFAVASPAGARLGKLSLAPEISLNRDRVTVPWERVEVLHVRPGTGEDAGAWGTYAADGGQRDDDKSTNGSLVVYLLQLGAVVDSPGSAPGVLQNGDVLALIQPETFDYHVLEFDY